MVAYYTTIHLKFCFSIFKACKDKYCFEDTKREIIFSFSVYFSLTSSTVIIGALTNGLFLSKRYRMV